MSADADMALRQILKQIANSDGGDFDRAYFAGQVDIIHCYFSPDVLLLDQAKQAVATMARKAG